MSIWYYIVYMLSSKAILCSFSFRDREAWKGLSEGKEQKEPFFCPFMFVTCQSGPRAMWHLRFFSKGTVSVQTIPADCPRCALLFSMLETSLENVILQCWPVQSVSLSLLVGVSCGNTMNKLWEFGDLGIFFGHVFCLVLWFCLVLVCLFAGWGHGDNCSLSPEALHPIGMSFLLDQFIPLPRQFPASPAELHPCFWSVPPPPDCTEYWTFLQT